MKESIALIMLLCVAAFAQQKGTFTDSRDGKKFKTVKIGTQTWMAENLNYATEKSKCYDNKPANCQKYGRLYDWADAMVIDEKFNKEKWNGNDANHQGVCPSGWHLPSDAEWKTLIIFIGNAAGTKLKAKNGWNKRDFSNRDSDNPQCKWIEQEQMYDDFGRAMVDGNGRARKRAVEHNKCAEAAALVPTDNFGFSALPGGYGLSHDRFGDAQLSFIGHLGYDGYWYSSTGKKHYKMYHYLDGIFHGVSNGEFFISVRCIKDDQ